MAADNKETKKGDVMELTEAVNVIAEMKLWLVGQKRLAEAQAARQTAMGWRTAKDKHKKVQKYASQIEALTMASAALGVVQLEEMEEAEAAKKKIQNGKKLSYNLQTRRTENLPAGARR
jgi:hypothetical protein